MKYITRIAILLGVSLLSLFVAGPVLAFPPLPSSFYGTVKSDGENVPDGTPVEALVNGEVYAKGQTMTYQGDSVYSLDVLGDDASTEAMEGGQDGDKVVFMVGSVEADQTGTWQGGTNINLDLSVAMAQPQDTSTPAVEAPARATSQPTQAAIPFTAYPEDAPVVPNRTVEVIGIVVGSVLIVVLWRILTRKPKA